jgi:predicted nucleic acid-binding protein
VGTLMAGKLLDTTVLIDLARGNTTAADYIDSERKKGTALYVSIISAMELVVGCRNKAEVAKAAKLIAEFSSILLNQAISQKAYELLVSYSKSHGLMIPDSLIAATALTDILELASDNDRHFKTITGLAVSRPY